jgi:regulator of sigma D
LNNVIHRPVGGTIYRHFGKIICMGTYMGLYRMSVKLIVTHDNEMRRESKVSRLGEQRKYRFTLESKIENLAEGTTTHRKTWKEHVDRMDEESRG